MKKYCLAASAALLLLVSQSRAQSSAPPLEAFGNLPTIEDVVLSPDGKKLAFVKTQGENRIIAVKEIGQTTQGPGAKVGSTKLRNLQWVGNEDLVATVSNYVEKKVFGMYSGEVFQLMAYDLPTGKVAPIGLQVTDEQIPPWIYGRDYVRTIDGKPTLLVHGMHILQYAHLPVLLAVSFPDLRTRVVDSSRLGSTWVVDENGRPAAQMTYRSLGQVDWDVKALKDGSLKAIASGSASIDVPELVGFNPDGSVVAEFTEKGSTVWKALNINDKTWSAPLYQDKNYRSLMVDRSSGRIMGAVVNPDNHLVFFDNEIQAHWDAVLRAFPNQSVTLVSHSDDFSKIVVSLFGGKEGYAFGLYDWYAHAGNVLTPIYRDVAAPAKVRRIEYAAADGLTIPGFLTLPPGVEEKSLPLVVLPHGGPAAEDFYHFDWWSQALAAQGYAVLQPNYRGSTVSTAFMQAGYGEWGKKMQSDLSDGVRHLAALGIIDPKRVCIVGASYGGYAALAGATLDASVYRCAVSVAGISDLRRFHNWIVNNRGEVTDRYWDRFLGTTESQAAGDAISPIEHIKNVTAPILLIHGKDDTVVPYEQSEVMLRALKSAGKSASMVTLNHEDHWLSTGATRLQMLQATVAFLKANNPPN
jgi:dipeptidyl aminopeptidase/acylaminoacyl peptidase